ncbi:hypothetical protein ACXR2T_07220 [Leucobacter sp. HY1910]
MSMPPPSGPWLPPSSGSPVPHPEPVQQEPQAWQPPAVGAGVGAPGMAAGAPGIPAGTPAGPQTWQPDNTPRGRRSRRRTITLVSVGVGLALLVAGAAVAVKLINDSRDPASQVEQYLDLLASGEAAKASKMVSPNVADTSLLTDEVLESATERIDVISVETLERGADGARVLARMSLAGEEFEHEFTVDQGPRELVVLETWELDDPLIAEAQLSLQTPVSAGAVSAVVDVAGTEVTLAETMTGDDSATVYVYPGVYEVAAGDLGRYLESDDGSATLVAGVWGESATASLTASLNMAFEDEILTQAAAYADGCVSIGGNDAVTGNMDAACPAITRNTRLSSLTVAKYAAGLSDISAKSFTTDQYKFEVRDTTAAARLDSDTSSLSGGITWRDGEPRIVDATFGWW